MHEYAFQVICQVRDLMVVMVMNDDDGAGDDGDDGEESHRSGGDGQIDKEDGQDGDHTFFLVKDPFVA